MLLSLVACVVQHKRVRDEVCRRLKEAVVLMNALPACLLGTTIPVHSWEVRVLVVAVKMKKGVANNVQQAETFVAYRLRLRVVGRIGF